MQLVGYMSGISKKGNPYCILYTLKPLANRTGWAGMQPQQISCLPEVAEQLIPEMIGQDCTMSFDLDRFGNPVCKEISL